MGDTIITGWIERLVKERSLCGPVLEVGSWRAPNHPDFFDYRPFFPEGTDYIGADLVEGLGVDVICDWTNEAVVVPGYGSFQTIITTCTLEHVRDPFALARNITRLLAPGGALIVSAPFVWVIHNYPDDYWRFTPSGIRALFPSITFDEDTSCITTPTGRTVYLSDAHGMHALDYIGIRYGTAAAETGFLTPVFLVQPGSFVSEGVNVNMIGTAPDGGRSHE